jgi:hypothetical protein
MFKIYFYFLKDSDWENDGYSIRDRLPDEHTLFSLRKGEQ